MDVVLWCRCRVDRTVMMMMNNSFFLHICKHLCALSGTDEREWTDEMDRLKWTEVIHHHHHPHSPPRWCLVSTHRRLARGVYKLCHHHTPIITHHHHLHTLTKRPHPKKNKTNNNNNLIAARVTWRQWRADKCVHSVMTGTWSLALTSCHHQLVTADVGDSVCTRQVCQSVLMI